MSEPFPDCELHFCEQRSDSWFELRRGILTASEFGEWLTERPVVRTTIKAMKEILDKAGIEYPKSLKQPELANILPNREQYATMTKGGAEARRAAACRLLAQAAGCWEPPRYENDVMRRGIELESESAACFEEETGQKVTPVGFARSIAGKFGCSPDGLIEETGSGFEGKAPLPEVHCKYVLDGWLPNEYEMQIHGSMAVTGAKSWWFQSYCPGLPPFRKLVLRDEFTEELYRGLVRFCDDLEETRKILAKRWEDWRQNWKPPES